MPEKTDTECPTPPTPEALCDMLQRRHPGFEFRIVAGGLHVERKTDDEKRAS